VTGVQTCALPIYAEKDARRRQEGQRTRTSAPQVAHRESPLVEVRIAERAKTSILPGRGGVGNWIERDGARNCFPSGQSVTGI
jgi:hypothetical protein